MGAPGGFCYADQPAFNAHGWTANETFTLGKIEDLLQETSNDTFDGLRAKGFV